MPIVSRLLSTGILRASLFDELSETSPNVGVTSTGTFYSTEIQEGTASDLNSSTPMRITSDKKLLVYDSFDELTEIAGIFDSLLSLAPSLNSLTSITNTNLGSVQSTIQAANSSFNVFAVATDAANAELLSGTASAGGKRTFTGAGFVYNSSASNILSTGKTIADMSGGNNNSLSVIDGKKWMAMAVYDGTTNGFRGILLWVFTGDLISNTNVVTANGHPITNTKDIFYPVNADNSFNRIYQVVIGPSGTIIASNVTGNAGWTYSSGSAASTAGYRVTSSFSADDGVWAFIVGGKTDGDTPGPSYKTANAYGFGNDNSSDSTSDLYWAGSLISGTSYVGFIFTGDA